MKLTKEILDFYNVQDKDKTFLYLILFRYNDMISDASFKGLIKSLNDGTLLTRKNTYHCRINDKWYNDEGILTIYEDVLSSHYLVIQPVPLENVIKYISIYLGSKPRNYCIDYIFSAFVKPVVENYDYHNSLYYGINKYLTPFGIENVGQINLNVTSYDNFSPSGYCCGDCDGDYEQYKQSNYRYYIVNDNVKELKKYFTEFMDSQKKFKNGYTPMYSAISF